MEVHSTREDIGDPMSFADLGRVSTFKGDSVEALLSIARARFGSFEAPYIEARLVGPSLEISYETYPDPPFDRRRPIETVTIKIFKVSEEQIDLSNHVKVQNKAPMEGF